MERSEQFTPFGQEIVAGQVLSATLGNQQPGDGTNMHYKFTGKERDSESGLDYFGAKRVTTLQNQLKDLSTE